MTQQPTGDFNRQTFAELSKPFSPADLEWRFQSRAKGSEEGMWLPYVTARAVMDRLDDVAGPGSWNSKHWREGDAWLCQLTVFGVPHVDGADASDIEPTKGGISDSLKRVAVRFGIGRYLYFLPRVYGRKNEKPKASLPPWALPGGSGRPPVGRGAAEGPEVQPEAQPRVAAGGADAQGFDWSSGQHAPAALHPAPEKPAPAAASSSGDSSMRAFPQATPPPINLSEVIKFGKYKDKRWGDVAIGDENSRRRSWLRWLAFEMPREKEWQVQTANRAQALLQWLLDPQAKQGEPDGDTPHGWPDDQGGNAEGEQGF